MSSPSKPAPHSKTKRVLDGILTQGRIANAYIFSSFSPQIAREAVAYFVAGLFGSTSPPGAVYEVGDDTPRISIETVRDIRQFIKYGPQAGQSHLVVVVPRAERMSTEAANAFLKSLEEPPAGVVFILTTIQAEGLLPTIRSRSQHLFCFQTSDVPKDCRPEGVLSFSELQQRSVFDRLLLVQQLGTDKEQLLQILTSWLDEAWAQQSPSFETIQMLIEKIGSLKYNVNVRLQLESLMLALK